LKLNFSVFYRFCEFNKYHDFYVERLILSKTYFPIYFDVIISVLPGSEIASFDYHRTNSYSGNRFGACFSPSLASFILANTNFISATSPAKFIKTPLMPLSTENPNSLLTVITAFNINKFLFKQ